ncbi:MAG: hypothetical protein ACXADW_20630, partial [Candidatus Hodarchaeales archaeon]
MDSKIILYVSNIYQSKMPKEIRFSSKNIKQVKTGSRWRKACIKEGCDKQAEGKTDKCARCGGGKRCITEGCGNSAAGKTDKCNGCGGGVRCITEGCGNSAAGGY